MSIETPNSAPKSTEHTDVLTPSADEIREAVHPELKKTWIDKHVDTRAKKMLALGAIGSVVLGGGAASYVALDRIATQNEQEAPNDNGQSIYPSAEATAPGATEPSPSSTSVIETQPVISEHELAVSSLEIKSGQSLEQLSKSIINHYSQWDMAGSEEADVDTFIDAGYAASDKLEYTQTIAAKEAPAYAEAIYGKDWQQNPESSREVGIFEGHNVQTLLLVLASSDLAAPFQTWQDYESSTQISGDTSEGTVAIDYVTRDSLASIPKLSKLGIPSENDIKLRATVSYTTVDGVIVVNGLVLVHR